MNGKKKAKRVEPIKKERRIDSLIRSLLKAQEELSVFTEANKDTLDRVKHLTDQCTGIHEMIKIEARLFSKVGTTVSVFDDGHLRVSVQGKEARIFNVADAKKAWPAAVLPQVIFESVNTAALDSLVKAGTLSENDVARAVRYEPMTPAVTIKFLK